MRHYLLLFLVCLFVLLGCSNNQPIRISQSTKISESSAISTSLLTATERSEPTMVSTNTPRPKPSATQTQTSTPSATPSVIPTRTPLPTLTSFPEDMLQSITINNVNQLRQLGSMGGDAILINTMALFEDLLIFSIGKSVHIVDINSLERKGKIDLDNFIYGLTVSETGQLAIWDNEGNITLWDLSTNKLLKELPFEHVRKVSFIEDNESLLIFADNKMFTVSIDDGKEIKEIDLGRPDSIVVDPSANIIAVGTGISVQFRNINSGIVESSITLQGMIGPMRNIALHYESDVLAVAFDTIQTAVIYDFVEDRIIGQFKYQSQANHIEFSEDGQYVTLTADAAYVWQRSTHNALRLSLEPDLENGITTLHSFFLDDDRQLLSIANNYWTLWNIEDGQPLRIEQYGAFRVSDATFLPNNHLFAATDRGIIEYDLIHQVVSNEIALPLGFMHLSESGSTAALRQGDEIIVFDLATGEKRIRFDISDLVMEGRRTGLVLSPDGQLLGSFLDGNAATRKTPTMEVIPGQLKVWDTNSGELLFHVERLGEKFDGVIFSPDSRRLASSDWNGRIRLWNLSGQLLQVVQIGPRGTKLSGNLAFSPDGSYLAISATDGEVFVYAPGTGSLTRVVGYAESEVLLVSSWTRYGLAFSPDGSLLASTRVTKDGDGVTEIFDWQNRRILTTLPGNVGKSVFSPDQKLIILNNKDIWGVLPE